MVWLGSGVVLALLCDTISSWFIYGLVCFWHDFRTVLAWFRYGVAWSWFLLDRFGLIIGYGFGLVLACFCHGFGLILEWF